ANSFAFLSLAPAVCRINSVPKSIQPTASFGENFADVQKVFKPLRLPRHVQEGIAFQTGWTMLEPETGRAKDAFRFADIPTVAADASAHGIDELNLWFPVEDATLPLVIRPELGSIDDLVEGIRKARESGVSVAPFVSIHYLLNSCLARYG